MAIPERQVSSSTGLEGVANLLAQLFGQKAKETTQTQVPSNILEMLQRSLGNLTGSDFSKNAAITDSQGQIAQLITNELNKQMPQLQAAPRSAGLYNDTTSTLLQNDLAARLAQASNAAISDNIVKYAQAATNQTNAASNAANATKSVTTNKTAGGLGTGPLLGLAGLSLFDKFQKGELDKFIAPISKMIGGIGGSNPIAAGDSSGAGATEFTPAAGPLNFAPNSGAATLADTLGAFDFASGPASFAGDIPNTNLAIDPAALGIDATSGISIAPQIDNANMSFMPGSLSADMAQYFRDPEMSYDPNSGFADLFSGFADGGVVDKRRKPGAYEDLPRYERSNALAELLSATAKKSEASLTAADREASAGSGTINGIPGLLSPNYGKKINLTQYARSGSDGVAWVPDGYDPAQFLRQASQHDNPIERILNGEPPLGDWTSNGVTKQIYHIPFNLDLANGNKGAVKGISDPVLLALALGSNDYSPDPGNGAFLDSGYFTPQLRQALGLPDSFDGFRGLDASRPDWGIGNGQWRIENQNEEGGWLKDPTLIQGLALVAAFVTAGLTAPAAAGAGEAGAAASTVGGAEAANSFGGTASTIGSAGATGSELSLTNAANLTALGDGSAGVIGTAGAGNITTSGAGSLLSSAGANAAAAGGFGEMAAQIGKNIAKQAAYKAATGQKIDPTDLITGAATGYVGNTALDAGAAYSGLDILRSAPLKSAILGGVGGALSGGNPLTSAATGAATSLGGQGVGTLVSQALSRQDGGEIPGHSHFDDRIGNSPNGPVSLAGGEYVVPTDVVDIPGIKNFLDSLVDMYHVPTKVKAAIGVK